MVSKHYRKGFSSTPFSNIEAHEFVDDFRERCLELRLAILRTQALVLRQGEVIEDIKKQIACLLEESG